MNTMETVTGKVPRMLILKDGENLKGNCSAWSKKTPLNVGFAEPILHGIMNT